MGTIEARERTDLFDYAGIDLSVRAAVQERVEAIRCLARQTAENIVLIGEHLSAVKEDLPHGAWLPWLQAEFGWAERTARNFIQVYEMTKSANFADLPSFDVSALYLLAAPSTPEPVRQITAGVAAAGQRVTHAVAQGVKQGLRVIDNPAVEDKVAARAAEAVGNVLADERKPATMAGLRKAIETAVAEAVETGEVYEEFETEAALVASIWSENAPRRHLPKGALAMVAATIYPEPTEATERGRGKKPPVTGGFPGVDHRRLAEARTVIAFAPDLVEDVKAGGPGCNRGRTS